MDEGRGILETSDPDAVDSGEVRLNAKTTTEIKGSSFPYQQKRDAYPRGQNQRNPAPGKREDIGYRNSVNQNRISNANIWGGGLDLFIKGYNGLVFEARMEAITKYLAEKKRLEVAIDGERKHVVPLKPATLAKLLADCRRHGRITVNPFEKEKILKTIIQLENQQEESYAFWK